MSARTSALEMALYNKWQNETLYRLCDALSDEDRKRDRGMFFHSIHETLDHGLMVDRHLLDFITTGQPPTDFDPAQRLHSSYTALKHERETFDDALIELIRERRDDWLDEEITFASDRLQRDRSLPRNFYSMQLFNHATHHRSQVTSELHKLGIDYGSTDLPMNPYSQY